MPDAPQNERPANNDDPVREEVLEWLASSMLPPIDPDEVTAAMLAERIGGYNQAKRVLDGAVKNGTMTCRQVRIGGHNATAYRRKSPGD